MKNIRANGLSHVKKVALDAGALILIDGADAVGVDRVNRLVFLSHLAGLLHDIRRSEPNHARRSAEEAGRILETFDIETLERDFIMQAIANHEAFQPIQPLDDPSAQMLSNALYDADKFRWGPDNFTETLWAIIKSRRLKLEDLVKYFPGGLEATERIRAPSGPGQGKIRTRLHRPRPQDRQPPFRLPLIPRLRSPGAFFMYKLSGWTEKGGIWSSLTENPQWRG